MPPLHRKQPARVSTKGLTLIGTLVVAASVGTGLWISGGNSAPKVTTAAAVGGGTVVPNMGVYEFHWNRVPNATAYRLWLDGQPFSVVPALIRPTDPSTSFESRVLSVVCGAIKHRFNAQGVSGSSLGPLGPPVYFTTPACK